MTNTIDNTNISTTKKLIRQIKKNNSILCVGLDPRGAKQQNYQQTIDENKRIIDATLDICACYKPNIAFYEQWGAEGLRALESTIEYIPQEMPVILDAKRGDIGATAEAYAYSAFSHFNADALTLSPYMGTESVIPFLKEGKLLFILSRTSNPSADTIQSLYVSKGKNLNQMQDTSKHLFHPQQELYLEVAQQFATLSDDIGFVVGANCYKELSTIRTRHPSSWILAPGIGAQGADIDLAITHGIGDDGLGLLPVVARGISNAKNPRVACKEFNVLIQNAISNNQKKTYINIKQSKASHNNASLQKTSQPLPITSKKIIELLFKYECIKIGTFTLKSGTESPFYIDLRRVISFPDLFALVTESYSQLLNTLEFNAIAGIPTAALPFAASVSQNLLCPMIYPRIPKKAHGSGNSIEGAWEGKKKVVLLDDLITKGSSKEEALKIFKEANIVVEDIVVLICRSYLAENEMNTLGVKLHYTLHIDDIIAEGVTLSYISKEDENRIKDFLQN